MCFIDDDQIPAAVHDGFGAFAVIIGNLFIGPAGAMIQRLDGVHGGDDLVKLTVNVLLPRDPANGIEFFRQDHMILFTEFLLHFHMPLSDQPSGADDQDPLDQSSFFQFTDHKTGFDRLPKPNLIGKDKAYVF